MSQGVVSPSGLSLAVKVTAIVGIVGVSRPSSVCRLIGVVGIL